MKMLSIEEELRNNSYPGRGIIIGKSTGRQKSGHGVFYHGTQREQPQPYFCGGRRGNPHTGIRSVEADGSQSDYLRAGAGAGK